jgi:hypothetical protein
MDEFAADGDVEELCIRYVSGPRNQPRLIFASTSEPSPYSSDHGEILAIIAMDVHGSAATSATLRFVAASSLSASPTMGASPLKLLQIMIRIFPWARTAHARGFGFQFFEVRIHRAPHFFIALTWGS